MPSIEQVAHDDRVLDNLRDAAASLDTLLATDDIDAETRRQIASDMVASIFVAGTIQAEQRIKRELDKHERSNHRG